MSLRNRSQRDMAVEKLIDQKILGVRIVPTLDGGYIINCACGELSLQAFIEDCMWSVSEELDND